MCRSLIHILNEPLAIAKSEATRFPAKELVQRVSAQWILENWGVRINAMVACAINRAEQEPLVFNSESIGHFNSKLDVKTAIQRFLVHVAMLDPSFANLNEEDLKAWLSTAADYDFYVDLSHCYSSNVPILLPNIICGRCYHMECIDLSVSSQEGYNCMKCSNHFDEGIIESRLVQIVDFHMLSLQNREIHCERCKSLKSLRCAKYCECGHRMCFATTQMNTRSMFNALNTLSYRMDFPWLRSVLEMYSIIM
eukprot:Gregarina_sp_Poly_1__8845@NODE_531_length_7661_cov_51_609033_g421_i0_p3_GENE_NODE_531_length_7661_cov_51_609033_g421_i0NODE_531_length_7661_cov_51_609033_g421_i0_p3_ORF_typecomplete_len252_score12_92PHD/PF00628_29/0_014PHD/PF00628_29/7_8e03DUF3795/PF12675_7/1_5e03DUF3795/PF12675_7/0_39_NODE_531_length_7661_cov_51_609033_g421_i06391394